MSKDSKSCRAKPRVLGVIPARGGSKRLKRKNIKTIIGHPLMAYTIWAAQKSKWLTDFVVSTEDIEILDIARKYGASTPFVRPKELTTDTARNVDVVLHALAFMEKKKKLAYDIIILLQPTVPIRKASHIDTAIKLLFESNEDTLASVKGPYKKRDPILKRIKNNILEEYCNNTEKKKNEPFYVYNASIYAVKRNYLLKEKKLISPRQVPLVMDQFHSIDIDTKDDFLMAEAVLKILKAHNYGD